MWFLTTKGNNSFTCNLPLIRYSTCHLILSIGEVMKMIIISRSRRDLSIRVCFHIYLTHFTMQHYNLSTWLKCERHIWKHDRNLPSAGVTSKCGSLLRAVFVLFGPMRGLVNLYLLTPVFSKRDTIAIGVDPPQR